MTVIKSTQANATPEAINAYMNNFDAIFRTPRSSEEEQEPSKLKVAGSTPAVEANCLPGKQHEWRETEHGDVFCAMCGHYIST